MIYGNMLRLGGVTHVLVYSAVAKRVKWLIVWLQLEFYNPQKKFYTEKVYKVLDFLMQA